MDSLNKNHLNILDLPNEILLIICNKLHMADVLYSLVNVTKGFDQLALDPLRIRHLDTTILTIKSVFDRTFSLDHRILDRICDKILPRIHHQVYQLTVEPHSIDLFLRTADYPQLYWLSFVDFEEKRLLQYLKDGTIVHNLLTEQITHLNIDIEIKPTALRLSKTLSNIFVRIVSICKRLIKLNFCASCRYRHLFVCIFNLPSTSWISSTLTTLNINVSNFADCLHLLDGRLNCLLKLIIHVEWILSTTPDIRNTKMLPELKYFSLASYEYTIAYDNSVIPLLRRMVNLEELELFLLVLRDDSSYIDGIELHDEILIYIPRLNKFNFSIQTDVLNENSQINLVKNEEIQRSFVGKRYGQVGSYVQGDTQGIDGTCHVYSLPYQFEDFLYLNNSFNGGMCNKVLCLKMVDVRYPFEHQFFELICQDFPVLKELYICNEKPQKDKQHSFPRIIFPYLLLLDLTVAHVDYTKQFLIETNTHLPRLLDLRINYESLALVTNNFTNDATRFTCAKLTCLVIKEPFVRPENFDQYFPLL